jgi:hypothetical protein
VTDDVLPEFYVPVPEDAAPVYVWLLMPVGIGGVATTLREASDVGHRAMDQHGDAYAGGILKAYPASDWPYVRLVPDAGWTRSTHEWFASNVARARPRKARRSAPGREPTATNTPDDAA